MLDGFGQDSFFVEVSQLWISILNLVSVRLCLRIRRGMQGGKGRGIPNCIRERFVGGNIGEECREEKEHSLV